MRYDYVGSNARMDQRSTKALVDRIREIKLDISGKSGPTSVDAVFHEMLALANHLPATVELWHCSLPEVFLQAMPPTIRDAVENDSTLSANLSATRLSTKDAQLHALRTVRTAASLKQTELDRIRKLMLETCAEHAAAAGAKTKATTSLMASESEKSVLKKKLRFSDGDASPVFLSPAEQTLQRYSQPNLAQSRGVGRNGLPIEDPVCVAKGNLKFPMNPTTQEISDFPLGFNGCFACGATDHRFINDCPKKNDAGAKQKLYKNLHCHKPHVRKAYEARSSSTRRLDYQTPSAAVVGTNPQQFVLFGNGFGGAGGNQQGGWFFMPAAPGPSLEATTTPSANSVQIGLPPPPTNASPPGEAPPTPAPPATQAPSAPTDVPRVFVTSPYSSTTPPPFPTIKPVQSIFGSCLSFDGEAVVIHNGDDSIRIAPSFLEKAIVLRNQQHDAHQFLRPPPMPISINNGLPNIVFPLSNGDSTVLELVALFDTCGSLNSGDLSFHLWLAASYPDIVHEILFDDGPEGFDPIKLMGAVKESANTPEKHGVLTAVIRYKTPFVNSSGAPMLLSFALGSSVSTNTILGWPSMLALGLSFDIHRFKIFSHVLNHEFHVLQDAGRLGIPVGVHFDLHEFRQRHDAAKTMTLIKSVPQSHGHAASSAYESIDSYDQGYLCRKLQPKSQIA
jgi:hypothetical protein